MIETIYLTDEDERFAPPTQPVLEVGTVGDLAFLRIVKYDESFEESNYRVLQDTSVEGFERANHTASVSVDMNDLVAAITLLRESEEVQKASRQKDKDYAVMAANGPWHPLDPTEQEADVPSPGSIAMEDEWGDERHTELRETDDASGYHRTPLTAEDFKKESDEERVARIQAAEEEARKTATYGPAWESQYASDLEAGLEAGLFTTAELDSLDWRTALDSDDPSFSPTPVDGDPAYDFGLTRAFGQCDCAFCLEQEDLSWLPEEDDLDLPQWTPSDADTLDWAANRLSLALASQSIKEATAYVEVARDAIEQQAQLLRKQEVDRSWAEEEDDCDCEICRGDAEDDLWNEAIQLYSELTQEYDHTRAGLKKALSLLYGTEYNDDKVDRWLEWQSS